MNEDSTTVSQSAPYDPSKVEPSLLDVMTGPAICIVLGVVVFGIGVQKANNEGKFPKFMWVAYVLTGIGALFGLKSLWDITNPSTGFLMRASIVSKKVQVAYYASFPLAILALAILFFWQRSLEKSFKEEAY